MKTPRYSDNRIRQHIILLILSSCKRSHFRPATARSTTTSATANPLRDRHARRRPPHRRPPDATRRRRLRLSIRHRPPPARHGRRRDARRQHGRRGEKTSSNATVSPVIRGCHGPVEEVVAAYLAGRIADSGDACAHHHEGGCPEHPAGRQAGTSPNDGNRCRRHDPQPFCGDLFERSPAIFSVKSRFLENSSYFWPRREFQRRGEASLRPDEKGIGCNSRTVPAAVNSDIRPERRMYSATRSGH